MFLYAATPKMPLRTCTYARDVLSSMTFFRGLSEVVRVVFSGAPDHKLPCIKNTSISLRVRQQLKSPYSLLLLYSTPHAATSKEEKKGSKENTGKCNEVPDLRKDRGVREGKNRGE